MIHVHSTVQYRMSETERSKANGAAAQFTRRSTGIPVIKPRGRSEIISKTRQPYQPKAVSGGGSGSPSPRPRPYPRATSGSDHTTRHLPVPGRTTKGGRSKENVPPSYPAQPRSRPAMRKPAAKSNMSYMELKKRHDDLLMEVKSRESQSQEVERDHMTSINRLAQEISLYRESNAALHKQIKSYHVVVEERTELVEGLQQQLEGIKFENERMAAILERARIDAITGEVVKKAMDSQEMEAENERELRVHEQNLDGFIADLEAMVTTLQVQMQRSATETALSSDH